MNSQYLLDGRLGLEFVEKRHKLFKCQGLKPDLPACTRHYTYRDTSASGFHFVKEKNFLPLTRTPFPQSSGQWLYQLNFILVDAH
jgi:hypothetical protein